MTPEQILDLLTVAAAFDNRTVGEGNVAAWLDAAKRGRWTFDEAAEAIKNYYAFSVSERPFVMPSHVTQAIKATRQDNAMRQQARELTAGPPHPRVARAIEEFARGTVIPEPREPRQPALRVPCPHCGAQPGQSCTRPTRGTHKPTNPHPSRVEAGEAHAR